ncbi:MAG TPA: hypothetical protein VM597_19760 [Gemmataceae bacterium]|jgi:hypothetical protein|nr:hypothetical protein [Gemmataceae bacterium]
MWGTVAAHLIPAAVTLYGLVVLVTGRAGGFGTRAVTGPLARVFGVILVAALPLAIAFGPLIKLDLFPRKPDFEGQVREIEITRDILAEYRALDTWRTENEPGREGETRTVPQIDRRIDELKAFEAAYRERVMEKEARVRELEGEQKGLREAREAREAEAVRRRHSQGAMWVGIADLLLVWAAIWLAGRKEPAGGAG